MRSSVAAGILLLMFATCFSVLATPASAALTPEWEYETPMGGPRTFPVIVQDEDGLVYVIGGVVNGTSWTSVPLTNSYDPETGAWTTLEPMVEGLRWATGALGHDGKVYVFAGWNDTHGSLYAPVQIYDPVDDSWSTGASIPLSVSFATAVTLGDGRIYVLGGRDSGYITVANMQIYDPVEDSWSAGTPLPAARWGGSAVERQGSIIFTGGSDSLSNPTSTVWQYYPDWGWYSLSSMPSAKELHACVQGGDGGIYVMGGGDEGAPSSEALRYDYSSDEWDTLPDLNFAMTYVSQAAYAPDGRVLVLGGTDLSVPARATDRVESLQILTESITLSASSVDQGGSVLVTVAYEFAYETPEAYGLYACLLLGGEIYAPTYVQLPGGGTSSFEFNVPQLFPAGACQIALVDIWVGYESGSWELGSRELPVTVLSALPLEDQLAALQDELSAMNASQVEKIAQLTEEIADLKQQLAAQDEDMGTLGDKADSANLWAMLTMVLVIVVLVMLALMFVMGRKKAA